MRAHEGLATLFRYFDARRSCDACTAAPNIKLSSLPSFFPLAYRLLGYDTQISETELNSPSDLRDEVYGVCSNTIHRLNIDDTGA